MSAILNTYNRKKSHLKKEKEVFYMRIMVKNI